jgi:adenine deaminase
MGRLIITGARLLDPEKPRSFVADVLVEDGLIRRVVEKGAAGLSPAAAPGVRVIEASGRWLAPGLIDPHLHVESSMLTPDVFAAAAVARGTTAVFVDPHEIANVRKEGIGLFLEISRRLPLEMYVGIPSCVPATDLESAGDRVTLEDIARLIDHPRAYGLAEMMNFPGIIHGFGDARARVDLAFDRGKVVDGHAPGVTGQELELYVSNGKKDGVVRVMSDHECTSLDEAVEKAERGMFVGLRYGSAGKDMEAILPGLIRNGRPLDRFMLCSDDLEAEELLERGHMDRTVRRAREVVMENAGLDLKAATLLVLRLASLNPGRYFQRFFDLLRQPGMGRLKEGFRADLVIVDDLESFKVNEVLVGGREVARSGGCLQVPEKVSFDAFLNSVNPGRRFSAEDFRIACDRPSVRANVIGVVPNSLLTKKLALDIRSEAGELRAAPDRDIAKVAVIERHKGTGRFALGLVRGLGLRRGAVASTVAHDSHNIIVAGVDDGAMAEAVNRLTEAGGGMIAVGPEGAALHPLEVAGLMSRRPAEETALSYRRARRAARQLGSPLDNVFMTLSFLALPVIPELKLTDRGLVDVALYDFVPLQ